MKTILWNPRGPSIFLSAQYNLSHSIDNPLGKVCLEVSIVERLPVVLPHGGGELAGVGQEGDVVELRGGGREVGGWVRGCPRRG